LLLEGRRKSAYEHVVKQKGHCFAVLKVENTEKSARVHLIEIGSVPPMGAQPKKDLSIKLHTDIAAYGF